MPLWTKFESREPEQKTLPLEITQDKGMAKKNDPAKSKMTPKSTIRGVSNTKTAIKPVGGCRKNTSEEEAGDDSLDRLLLVHSDISSLLTQIDELVVQALQLTNKKGIEEIRQFSNVLSEMQTFLKPWLPRLQKAVSNPSTETENKTDKSKEKVVVCEPEKDTDVVTESPEKTKWESLVSASPLVSWRAESRTESCRQLFLLTPLHRSKTFSTKCHTLSVPASEKITFDEISQPVSHLDSFRNLSQNVHGDVSTKPTLTETITNFENECASPDKFSSMNCSRFVMTPSFKMSPPKSCLLLEPVSEFSKKKKPGVNRPIDSESLSPPKTCIMLEPVSEFLKKKKPGVHKSTPFPIKVQNSSDSGDSESSSSQNSDDLSLKYPELFGIKLAHTMGNRMRVLEESPDWSLSPPKTCVIMEPLDDNMLTNLPSKCSLPKTTLAHTQLAGLSIMKINDPQQDNSTLGIAESTPMFKEPVSSFRKGKHPGENTLKRELWTRFEAATTTHGIHFNDVALQSTSKKGFLDQLDEASDAKWN